MSVKVTFEFDSAAEAAAFLADCGAESDAPAGEAPAAAPRGRGRPRKVDAPAPAGNGAASPAAPTNVPAQSAMTATVAPAVPFSEVADLVTKLADIDTPKAKDILASFGVKQATLLKVEQYPAVVEAFKAALAKPAAASLI